MGSAKRNLSLGFVGEPRRENGTREAWDEACLAGNRSFDVITLREKLCVVSDWTDAKKERKEMEFLFLFN